MKNEELGAKRAIVQLSANMEIGSHIAGSAAVRPFANTARRKDGALLVVAGESANISGTSANARNARVRRSVNMAVRGIFAEIAGEMGYVPTVESNTAARRPGVAEVHYANMGVFEGDVKNAATPVDSAHMAASRQSASRVVDRQCVPMEN